MDEAKKDAGYRAADLVRDGMVIGLGTGSTVLYAMESIASRMCDEDLRIAGVRHHMKQHTGLSGWGFHSPRSMSTRF